MEIKKPFNSYQEMNYRLAYSTTPKKRIKATHYCCFYGTKCLTQPMSYALCQENLKQYRMMGIQFPNKDLLQIKPAKT